MFLHKSTNLKLGAPFAKTTPVLSKMFIGDHFNAWPLCSHLQSLIAAEEEDSSDLTGEPEFRPYLGHNDGTFEFRVKSKYKMVEYDISTTCLQNSYRSNSY